MKTPSGYASPPATPPALEDCSFYHTIELPGLGVQLGQWDLRSGIRHYFGNLDFSGKRVLEIGTANGFVCFEMERRGADVVAFDLDENLTYDAPPYPEAYLNPASYRDGLRRIRNGFWLAHHLMGSRAKVAYGHANHLPEFLGTFDIGVLGNVLQHLRDPIGAVLGVARICDAIIITESDWFSGSHNDLKGMIYFDKDNPFSWYQVKPPLLEAFLKRMGFADFHLSRHTQLFAMDVDHTSGGPRGRAAGVEIPQFTLTAERVQKLRKG